jgi:hypothetical protein
MERSCRVPVMPLPLSMLSTHPESREVLDGLAPLEVALVEQIDRSTLLHFWIWVWLVQMFTASQSRPTPGRL